MLRSAASAPDSDEYLACQAQQGCMASFEELLRRFQTPVLQFLRHRGLAAEAEDVTQETFLRVYENLHRYDRQWPFSAWLFTIARRTGMNYRRRERPSSDLAAMATSPSTYAEPLAALIAAENRRRLWELAAIVLSEEQLSTVWLHYVEDMSLRNIALVLGRSQASVKIMLFRARRKLLPLVGEFDDQRRRCPLPATREAPCV
jgi:RNA polymerase sigma-70 factor, ECF subfamily